MCSGVARTRTAKWRRDVPMKRTIPLFCLLALLAASNPAAAAPPQKAADGPGVKLLSDLLLLIDRTAQGKIDVGAANAGVVALARDLKAARDAKSVDPLFAVRYSRLLSAVRQALLTDPEMLYWPMYRYSMVDFIEERTGQMPDWGRLLFVVGDHGGSGVGLATLVEAVTSEIVSLHIHLETLERRPAVLQTYLERLKSEATPEK
jgi:hypothetical protein